MRAIRLRALQDAPDAFGATLRKRVPGLKTTGSSSQNSTTFVAVEDGRDLAMVPLHDATSMEPTQPSFCRCGSHWLDAPGVWS